MQKNSGHFQLSLSSLSLMIEHLFTISLMTYGKSYFVYTKNKFYLILNFSIINCNGFICGHIFAIYTTWSPMKLSFLYKISFSTIEFVFYKCNKSTSQELLLWTQQVGRLLHKITHASYLLESMDPAPWIPLHGSRFMDPAPARTNWQ